MTEDTVIQFQNVTKRFGKVTALADISLAVPKGAVVGLIGKNDSGKTTLLHHVTSLQLPPRALHHVRPRHR